MAFAFLALAATAALISSAVKPEGTPPAALRPVILVHGFKDTSAKMQPLARVLRAEGREVHTPSLQPSWGQAGIAELARQLDAFISENFAPEQPVDIVAFSMGGIVARYYLQRLGGLPRVAHFITISTPHRGTVMANLCPPFARKRRPGIADLTINSPLLRELNADAAVLDQLRFTSVWTPLDLMILPAGSSRMTGARDVMLWVVAHPLMVWEPRCLRRIVALLRE